jgi:phosphoribosylformimino-5-aminoimidazole carboxamide ribotide isomerase
MDLKDGLVVRGAGGDRANYRPVTSVLAENPTPSNVARAFATQLGCHEVYVADLDAIAGAEPAWLVLEQIAGAGMKMLVDAGAGTPQRARQILDFASDLHGWCAVVVGLESSPDPAALAATFHEVGPERSVFSLDLKEGRPMSTSAAWGDLPAEQIADAAVRIGFRRMIVLDLAHVGANRGTGIETLCRTLRDAHPAVELIGGGGVRGIDDLRRLARGGCHAALVASALHDGRLGRDDLMLA